MSSSSLSSVSETPDVSVFIYKDWFVSQNDHVSESVHYAISMYDNVELKNTLINHNTINNTEYFSYDTTGTGKHFIPFPTTGLKRPPHNTIVRYQINKNRCKRFFLSKTNNLYQISLDSNFIKNQYDFNDKNILNISLNNINGDICSFCDNGFLYKIDNADLNSKTKSMFLGNDILFLKVDGTRNCLWQINKNDICLKNYYGIEIFSETLPIEINRVLKCIICKNTGELFILAESALAISGTVLISYLKNRGTSDFYYTDYAI